MAAWDTVTERLPSGTIKAALDLSSLRSISSADLLAMSADGYHDIRRSGTRARWDGTVLYACPRCSHGLYAPRERRTGLPYWRHHGGAPKDCPWWTGTPAGVDGINHRQFRGAQEGPLHVATKTIVGELLAADSHTEPGSVVVDEYLVTDGGRRRPDVRAIYGRHPIAVQIQLATTQILIILNREDCCESRSYRMPWVTYDFRPPPLGGRLVSSIEDVFCSHGNNIFSIDHVRQGGVVWSGVPPSSAGLRLP